MTASISLSFATWLGLGFAVFSAVVIGFLLYEAAHAPIEETKVYEEEFSCWDTFPEKWNPEAHVELVSIEVRDERETILRVKR